MSIEARKDFRWLKRCTPPPQLVVVEFGEEDVVVCSNVTTGGFNPPSGPSDGDGEDVWD